MIKEISKTKKSWNTVDLPYTFAIISSDAAGPLSIHNLEIEETADKQRNCKDGNLS